ncbi:MAG: hypothetical protein Q9177_006351 [Variospora cf. flavescens]
MPPPLSMEPPSQLERNGQSLPTPSSTSAAPSTSVPTEVEEPPSTSSVMNGKKYSLEVAQQPIRARMCGFGDKDRRPITPPPCIRLVVRDANPPYNEIDMNHIEIGFLVLTVDLWDAEGKKEVNLVKHSQTSPSISAATAASYPPPNTLHNPYNLPNLPSQYLAGPVYHPAPPAHQMLHQPQMYAAPSVGYPTHPYQQQPQPMYHHQHHIPPPPIHTQHQPHQAYYATPSGTPITASAYYGSQFQQAQGPLMSPQHIGHTTTDPNASTPTPPGMFTRNLIGSLGVSAFKLTDNDNNMGIWFILQDLSVRTEGSFRLKMSFVNVGSPTGGQSPNSGSAPVLASCFSQPFQVFSAKKFPGVIESTPLSKCFATQGIKIPIRKDVPRGNIREDDEDGS